MTTERTRPRGLESASRPATPRAADGDPADGRRSPEKHLDNQARQRLHRGEGEGGERSATEAVLGRLGAGRPLDATLGHRLGGPGSDLGGVRLHSGGTASRLAAEHRARAFTVGEHVVFGEGQLRPGTLAGDALLAHELAHVEQQRRGNATGRGHAAGEARLEADADRSAASALLARIAGAGRRLGAGLAAPLSLQGCFLLDQGPPKSLEEQFVDTQTGWTGDLESGQTDRIRAAVAQVAGDNPALQRAFYQYYVGHEINLQSGGTLEEWREAYKYAETSGGSDTLVDPRILEQGFNSGTLGTLLFHELVHTRHPAGNPLGMNDYLEGEAYAVEYFLAQRSGADARSKEIVGIMSGYMYGASTQVAAWRSLFRNTYGAMDLLQRRIDGRDLPGGVPASLSGLSSEEAQQRMADLLVTPEDERSPALRELLEWVAAHQGDLDLPI